MKSNDLITVPSSLIAPRSDQQRLTPAMCATLWEIAAVLDERRTPASVGNSVWLEIPARRLRGPDAQRGNRWLRECLRRLAGLTIEGEQRGDPWGAVLLSEWHIERGGTMARLLIPPAAVQALRAPATFAKVEIAAAHRLAGHGRRLYVLLADKKRLGRPCWRYELDDLREQLGLSGKYKTWKDFRKRVLDPALAAVNDFGTVDVEMTLEKTGRRVTGVRFSWRWKTLDEITVTAEETEQVYPYAARPPAPDAPPLVPETRRMRHRNATAWWNGLPTARREQLEAELRHQLVDPAADAKKSAELDGLLSRDTISALADDMARERIINYAYEQAHPAATPWEELPAD